MKQIVLVFSLLLSCATNIWAQLEDEGQIGWVQSDTKESRVSFQFISLDGSPAYVKVVGQQSTEPCYIPLDKMGDFRKYLQKIYKIVAEWDKDSLKTSQGNLEWEIPVKPVDVILPTVYNLHYKEDKELKHLRPLTATWEYYSNDKAPKGSYVAITAEIESPDNPSGYNRFKIWVTLDEITFILKKIINANEIYKWENHVVMRNSEKNRNATDINRRLKVFN